MSENSVGLIKSIKKKNNNNYRIIFGYILKGCFFLQCLKSPFYKSTINIFNLLFLKFVLAKFSKYFNNIVTIIFAYHSIKRFGKIANYNKDISYLLHV